MNRVTLKIEIITEQDVTRSTGDKGIERKIETKLYEIRPSEWLTLQNKLDAFDQRPKPGKPTGPRSYAR